MTAASFFVIRFAFLNVGCFQKNQSNVLHGEKNLSLLSRRPITANKTARGFRRRLEGVEYQLWFARPLRLGSFLVIVALGWRKQGRMGQPWLDPTVWHRRKMLCLIEVGGVGRHPIDVLS